jgi:hypothetical protein
MYPPSEYAKTGIDRVVNSLKDDGSAPAATPGTPPTTAP